MPSPESIDIFVSYTRADIATVSRLVATLRAAGLAVWIDHSGIAPGGQWRADIIDALHRSRLLLLVHSPHAEQSVEVAKEVAAAASLRKPIVPLRIEQALPRGALLYEMARLSWVDAIPPEAPRLEEVALALRDLLQSGVDQPARSRFEEAVGARHFRVNPVRRLLASPLALGCGWVTGTLLFMATYAQLTGYLHDQLAAGVSMGTSLLLLVQLATLGLPVVLLSALARQPDAASLPLAVLAVVNLMLGLAWLRSLARRAWLRWSIQRAGRQAAAATSP